MHKFEFFHKLFKSIVELRFYENINIIILYFWFFLDF